MVNWLLVFPAIAKVVALDSTDFTDVAAVVITVADSRSGILTKVDV